MPPPIAEDDQRPKEDLSELFTAYPVEGLRDRKVLH
jgi:hypothetical protein